MIKKILLPAICILVFSACQSTGFVKVSIKGTQNFPALAISDPSTALPVIIGDTTGQNGSFFFETATGKTWITGKPDKISQTTDKFEAVWKMPDRVVTVKINRDQQKQQYNFSFEATPDSGILKRGINIAASDTEYFTGLFERTVDGEQKESWKEGIQPAMDLHGQEIDMIIKPTLSLYSPFYLSSAGYGLFIKSTWPGHYDMCKSNPGFVQIEFEGPTLTGTIYTSDKPAEIIQAHSQQVGTSLLPPKWAFLPWRWRDNHVNLKTYYDGTPVNAPYNSQLVEDVLMMKAFDIPCGAYWVDRPWATGDQGYNDFEWDTLRFPHPDKMIDWLHENDMKFLLWAAPWVAGNMKTEAFKKGYGLPMKPAPWGIDTTKATLIDFTNPEACKWLQEKGIEKMLKQGVNGFKLDRAEEVVPESRDIIAHDGRTARELRNGYPVLYAKTFNESCRKIYGDDFVMIQRAGYTGSAAYTSFWGGDIGSPAEGLRTAIIAVQRSAVNGYAIWGSDIGGYWHGELDREVCARWLAFGCFTPIMEFGPTEDHAPWDMLKNPHYDTQLIAIWRLYAKIHTSLADYTHQQAIEANKQGTPIVRPLFMEFPEQKEAWENWQSFMYGPDILVSAIWQKNDTLQTCYLPAGTKWRDAWDTTKIYNGGQAIQIKTPLYKIPVFIRENASIDLGDLNKLYQESLDIAAKKPDLSKLEKTIE